jgi:hypothetical protein
MAFVRRELGIEVVSVTQPLGREADDPAAFLTESVHDRSGWDRTGDPRL